MLLAFFNDRDDRTRFDAVVRTCYAPDSPRWKSGHEPDARHFKCFLIIEQDNVPVARCALYENPGITVDGASTLLIGSYECVIDATVAKRLFSEVESYASTNGYKHLIGPMDGSTWNSHRFTESSEHFLFFPEAYHHPYYPAQWQAHGFAPIEQYVSRIDNKLLIERNVITDKEAELSAAGIHIRPIRLDRVQEEFTRIGTFCMSAFKENRFFTPIPVEEFVAKYMPIAPVLKPELVLLAEDARGMLLGFILAFPDLYEPEPTRRALIVKTVATSKDAPVKGIGHHLLRRLEEVAVAKGFRKTIHAFMSVQNRSASGSHAVFGSEPYGSYTLYHKHLP
ncbi:MAG TPA: GNAT family N-acetyltransferase [Flavobacteriales bacterium]|nr:GNAT family N-acetyltransferase [Flavobacteriales bacterium]